MLPTEAPPPRTATELSPGELLTAPDSTLSRPEEQGSPAAFRTGSTSSSSGATRSVVLCAVFFLSGASALVFENLWFQGTGLVFGNGVWSSALVLSSFMAGLALGNGIAARIGGRVRSPERLYAGIEILVAITGVALVLLLPHLIGLVAPLLGPLLDRPVALGAVRLGLSFLLLMIPATAMGMTLPLLVKALHRGSGSFGSALGHLYGWNTLGAVAGCLLAETLLVKAFGIRGAAVCAGLFNLLAAAGALYLARYARPDASDSPASSPARNAGLSGRTRRLLAASFVAGAALLALEVVGFRFLQLFLPGTTLVFAAMLCVVLTGIGAGSLCAARWQARRPGAEGFAPIIALAAGTAALLAYVGFDLVLGGVQTVQLSGNGLGSLGLCVFLLLPVSCLSGVLFSMTGALVHAELGEATRSAGATTLANTVGASVGPLLAVGLLIPWLGMEKAFFAIGLSYLGCAALLARPLGKSARRNWALSAVPLGFLAVAVLFPFGKMQRYIGIASAAYTNDSSRVIATREGLTATLQYVRTDYRGEPHSYRLVTNSFSMSGTLPAIRRYMKYYVYWPVAVHPALDEALLISFGTGSTAKALTDTRSLESIVVVDISPEVLEMADVVFPEAGSNPLDDPRVETVVEDGRFYLETTDRRFDLITSEPPPPKIAGVTALYSREYFQLLRDRLAEGGMVTYWLPVGQLRLEETQAILRAFHDVFGEETSLWSGSGLEWMLVGTRNAQGGVDAAHFGAQWRDPEVLPELRALGFEEPRQLSATFLMDAAAIGELTADSEPLVDAYPKRLSSHLGSDVRSLERYAEIMQGRRQPTDLSNSASLRLLWPQTATLEPAYWTAQEALNNAIDPELGGTFDLPRLHEVLTETGLEAPILWSYGSDATIKRIALEEKSTEDTRGWDEAYSLAVCFLVERDFLRAERFGFEALQKSKNASLLPFVTYLMCLNGNEAQATELVGRNPEALGHLGRDFEWIAREFGLRFDAGT